MVVTSARGARSLLEGAGAAPPARVRWAAVGPRTSAELDSGDVRVSAVPERPLGVEVAGAIAAVEPLSGLRVLLARADAASADLPRALSDAGARVTELSVYHTVEGPEASRAPLNHALEDPGLRAVVFASGSAARGLVRLADRDPRGLVAVTIGPATTSAARREGFRVAAEATRPGLSELVAAVRSALSLAPGP